MQEKLINLICDGIVKGRGVYNINLKRFCIENGVGVTSFRRMLEVTGVFSIQRGQRLIKIRYKSKTRLFPILDKCVLEGLPWEYRTLEEMGIEKTNFRYQITKCYKEEV